jgi:tetratricopeptide (TPR) repeat protein
MGFIGYVSYGYFFVYKPIDHNYPKAVAAKLKRGIYHTSLEPDLHKALKYYQQALVAAEEEKMNPFSDEVIGIKLRIAKVLEENQRLSASIKALEMLRADIHRYLGIYGDRDDLKQHRTRLLRKVVQVSVKLGQLYASEAVDDLDEAEKNLTEGVETALTEARRRETEKVSDDVEGPWLSNEEMGGALEGKYLSILTEAVDSNGQ